MNTERSNILFSLGKYSLGFLILALGIFFGLNHPQFFQAQNLLNILSSACITALIGISLTIAMAADEFDNSVGAQMTLAAIFVTKILTKTPINNYWIAVVLTLLAMICLGLFNAFLHVKIKVPAFISTLGTYYIYDGIGKYITKGANILGAGKSVAREYVFFGQGYLFGFIPMPAVVLAVVGIVTLIITERTAFGKSVYAVGNNGVACSFVGINTAKVKTMAFVFGSLVAGITGIVQCSKLNGVTNNMGDSMLLYAMITTMLGATFMKIGVYNVPGTIVGALMLSVLNNGMTMMGAKSYIKNFVEAAVLITACAIVAYIKGGVNIKKRKVKEKK